ncbi:MAG: hypothetical protein VX619_02510 [bacterium]|nr:hypothetical protein [bacterium]
MNRILLNSTDKDEAHNKSVFLIKVISVAIALLLSISIFVNNWNFFHDDAYITLRYANNWISGHGLVWNEGEFVQGYTNFLYLIIISTLGYLGLDLVFAARLISITAYVATAILLWYCGYLFKSQYCKDLRHLPVVIFMTSASVIVWTLGGLETVVFGFFILVGSSTFLFSFENKHSGLGFLCSGVFFGFAFLTRPDGILFIGVTSAFLFWSYLKCLYQKGDVSSGIFQGSRVSASRKLALYLIMFLVGCFLTMSPYIVWQVSYYGDFVPNTFYAKSGIPFELKCNNGIYYFLNYLTSFPFFLILICILLVDRYYKSLSDFRLNYLVMLILAYLGFIVFIAGGDHMQSFRMMAPIVPLISIILTYLLSSFGENTTSKNLIISFFVISLSFMQIFSPELNPQEEDLASFYGTIVGKYISSEWNRDALIALNTAGSTPYYAPSHRFIDMLGLNDSVIARRNITSITVPWQSTPGHFKGDGDYVLSRNPDFIILGPADGTNSRNAWFLSDYELIQDQEFQQNYKLMKVFLDLDGKVYQKTDTPLVNQSVSNYKSKYSNPYILFRYFQKRDKPINNFDF